jgi:hypothetical protein
MAELLTLDRFRPAVGEPFVVCDDRVDGLALVLAEARSLGPGYADREAFALLFHGPREPLLPQATYRLANERVGEHDIFIVPVGRTADGLEYEAIFT